MEHNILFGNSNRENGTTFLDLPLFLGIFQWDEATKRVPFTAKLEIPDILTKWKAPCDYFRSNCRIPGHSKAGTKKCFYVATALHQFLGPLGTEVCLKNKAFTLWLWGYAATGFSKIQLVVYYQCCILIGWATIRLYVIAHYIASSKKCGLFGGKKGLKSSFN